MPFLIQEQLLAGPTGIDFAIRHQGEISLLYPISDDAQEFIYENLNGAHIADRAVVIPKRDVNAVVFDILGQGLSLHEAKRTVQ